METLSTPSMVILSSEKIQSIKQFIPMSQDELDRIYTTHESGPIPNGASDGRPIFFAGSAFAGPLAFIAPFFWQGKIFDAEKGTLLNRVLGFRTVKAKLYHGESLLDARPSVIIDYQGTSVLFGKIRDEIRLIEPETLGDLADRRVFVAEQGEKVIAFLVASPIPAATGGSSNRSSGVAPR